MLLLSKYLKASKLLIIVCLLLFKNLLISQTNLIQNSSFEHYSSINCVGGASIINNWSGFMSPDYNSVDCSNNYRGVPYNNFGVSYPKQGNAFMGFISYVRTNTAKEYPYQQLASTLIADSVYCLSFFISRADYIPYAIKSIGAYFSIANPSSFGGSSILATPQVVNQTGFLTDTIGWIEVQGCFTAFGGEKYITIGNFNDNNNTDTLFVGTTNQVFGANGYAYYYIDSVTLWKNNFPTFIKEDLKSEIVSVYPNPASSVISIKLAESIAGVEAYQIKITDVLGREVMVSEFKEQLHISQLETGIYFVSILQGQKTLVTKKVAKQ